MKKLLLILFALVILFLAVIYSFIPSRIDFGNVIYIHANRNITSRYIADQTKWVKWWPANTLHVLSAKENKELSYTFKNYNYTITREAIEGTSILIKYDSKEINSFLHLIALKLDSVWQNGKEDWKQQIIRLPG